MDDIFNFIVSDWRSTTPENIEELVYNKIRSQTDTHPDYVQYYEKLRVISIDNKIKITLNYSESDWIKMNGVESRRPKLEFIYLVLPENYILNVKIKENTEVYDLLKPNTLINLTRSVHFKIAIQYNIQTMLDLYIGIIKFYNHNFKLPNVFKYNNLKFDSIDTVD